MEIPWLDETVWVHTDGSRKPAEIRLEFQESGRKYSATVVYGAEAWRQRCPFVQPILSEVCPLWAEHDGPHIRCAELLQVELGEFCITSMRTLVNT